MVLLYILDCWEQNILVSIDDGDSQALQDSPETNKNFFNCSETELPIDKAWLRIPDPYVHTQFRLKPAYMYNTVYEQIFHIKTRLYWWGRLIHELS